jgi:outer membrane protein assembly factor BamB
MKPSFLIILLLISFLGAVGSFFAETLVVSATVTSTPSPPMDQSVTWQNNVQHDGNDPGSSLSPPLVLKWKKNLAPLGITLISYPLIAQGRIIVTTTGDNFSNSVFAFNAANGQQLWTLNIPGTYGFLNAAYDADKVFVINFDGLLRALDAATGALRWSVQLPGQYAFTSPPTAVNGVVFVGGAGTGGTLYAVDENNGNVMWTSSVENGDHSSPAVNDGRVFVSYACPQAYAFATTSGQQLWHYSGPCEGGGGKTPVIHLGKVYVRDSFFDSTNGLVLNADTGARLGNFASDTPPAFTGNLGVYLQSETLRGINISNGQVLWSFAGNGDLTSAPLIVNQTIYIGSSSGLLYGLDLQGHQSWSTQVGAAIPAPDEQNAFLTTGLGAGNGLLAVPAGSILAVYSQPLPYDFNSDGHTDYLLYNGTTRETLIWHLNNNVTISSVNGPTFPAGWQLVDVADFNHDNKPDCVLFNGTTRQTMIWYMSDGAHNGSADGPTIASGYNLVAAADFDGDGKPDFVLYNPTRRRIAIWYLNGNLFHSSAFGPALPVGYSLAGTADFNYDGHIDLALFNPSNQRSLVYYLSGPGFLTSAWGPVVAAQYQLVGVGDFNSDHKPDFVLYNSAARRTAIWYLNNNLLFSSRSGPALPSGYTLAAP